MQTSETVRAVLKETARLHERFSAEDAALIEKAGALMAEAVGSGHKLIWFGNGGSATQSQHMAAEFVGRFQRERKGLASISLTENMASVTAIGNDYGYARIFARQMEALGQVGDVAIGLSTSGNSENVVLGLQAAKEKGMGTIGMTGEGGGKIAALCDLCICIPSKVTARIQEVHLTVGHLLCELVEASL